MDQSSGGGVDRSSGGGWVPEAQHLVLERQVSTCLALQGFESLHFSCFRFYLCLFSGPSTFLPKVRDPEFSGLCRLDSLLKRLASLSEGLGLVVVQAFWGRTDGLRDLQGDLKALWFLQGLNEVKDEEAPRESTFMNKR